MIYVDQLQDWGWKLGPSCHLFCDPTDNIENLHAFAAAIGMKRQWFQSKPGKMPHYDLVESRRKLAVRDGAIQLDRRGMVEVMNKWKGQG